MASEHPQLSNNRSTSCRWCRVRARKKVNYINYIWRTTGWTNGRENFPEGRKSLATRFSFCLVLFLIPPPANFTKWHHHRGADKRNMAKGQVLGDSPLLSPTINPSVLCTTPDVTRNHLGRTFRWRTSFFCKFKLPSRLTFLFWHFPDDFPGNVFCSSFTFCHSQS